NVGPVLKDDVDEGLPEHRFASDKAHFRRSNKCGGDWIRDLVFDEIGRASFPFGVNDDLRITQIRNGIEWRVFERIDSSRDCKEREDEDEETIPHAGCDDALEHCLR